MSIDLPLISTSFPTRVTLELTNKCNLNCSFCPRKLMAQHQGFMDMSLFMKLVGEIKSNLPVKLVPFFRGEPLLHPHFLEILSILKKEGIGPIQLGTNGSLLTESMAKKILEMRVDFVSFSIGTMDPQLFEKTRETALFKKVISNVHKFLELRDKIQDATTQVQISTIETSSYKKGIPEFVKYWQGKVDRIRVYLEHSTDGKPGSILKPLTTFEERLPCKKVWTDIVIYWDGDVALCNHDWTRGSFDRIGSVCETSIKEVWNSAKYKEIRAKHRTGSLESESLCNGCDHWKMYYLPQGYLGEIHT